MTTKSSLHLSTLAVLASSVALLAAMPGAAQQKPSSGPVARYDMRAGTISGAGAGGRGGMGAAMMFGGGRRSNNVQRELYLRLGSSQAATGSPKADHFMPDGALLGRSVPLATPREERVPPEGFPEGQRPKGRLLVYWGCGEHAGAGQPVVIDFARLAAGQVPPGLWSSTVLRDWGPTIANSRTFGRWPAEDGKFVKPGSSLIGAHRVAGNYSPEISFTLAKDFMAPLATRLRSLPSGSRLLAWDAIPDATGYLAGLFGGSMNQRGEMGDMVMWSSSATRQFGGGLEDWLSPGQVAGLVRDRTVLGPEKTSCAIPAEVIRDAGQFRMGRLTAFGPEESFAYPPRPANPKAAWNVQWTARVRHKSSTSWMDMPGMGGMGGMGQGGDDPRGQPQERPRRGLGGMLGGGLGF
ncbi:hypothetical protein ACFOD9_10495 [Novosphingobium bradum]|uniref:Uncharacterized protein n=1 Tax=Novosphingobium bradum TaxID=1737444 RepID=A0ABV7IRV3_9SPHN